MLNESLTREIIACFYKVYNTLGYGFLEKVYENALAVELGKYGFEFKKQFPINVYYQGINVGEYYADIIVENKVIIELKTAESIREEHEFQLINYLKATGIEVGLLLNFGKKAEFKRKIFTSNK